MSDTTFVDKQTVIPATWIQDVNNAVYRALGAAGIAPATAANVIANLGLETAAHATATWAPLVSPALTGNPTAPTPSIGDSDTSIATTAFVMSSNRDVVNSYGADYTGAVDSTTAFQNAIAAGGAKIPPGIYLIGSLTIAGEVTFQGAGKNLVVIQGNGDLFNLTTANSQLHLSGCTLQNVTTRGKLVKKTYNGHMPASSFNEVHFKKANYHIYTETASPGDSIVGWNFSHCRFIDAAVASRHHGSIWASSEFDCYTWLCHKGLEIIGNISTVQLCNSVFELMELEAINVTLATLMQSIGLSMIGVHFEGNGTGTPTSSIKFDQAAGAFGFTECAFVGCTEFNPTTTPTLNINQTNVTSSNDFVFESNYNFTTNGAANGNVWSGSKYDNTFSKKTLGSVKRQFGILGGNGTVQIANIPISISEAHRVQVYTLTSGVGTVNSFQEYVVYRDGTGATNFVTIHDTASGGYGCTIVTGAGVYTLQNKAAMPSTFHPYIIIDKL